jgi:O-antigen/teichoic acid export membrane protein
MNTLSSGPRNDESQTAPTMVGGSSALLISQTIGNAAWFVGVLVVARSLGPDGRGTVAFLTVTALALGFVARLGVSEATLIFAAQRIGARPQLLANAVFASFATGTVGALIFCGALLAFPSLRPGGVGPAELLALVPAVIAASLLQSGLSFLLGCRRFRQMGLISSMAPWLYPALLILLWGIGRLSVFTATLAWAAAIGFWALLLIFASAQGLGRVAPNWKLLSESMRFGIRAWVGSLARLLNFRIDQVLIGFIATETTLGIYSVAVNFSELLFYLPAATATALAPVVAATPEKDRGRRTLSVFRAVAVVTCAGLVLAAVLGPLLLPILFGDAFRPSVVPFLLLLPGALGFMCIGIFSSALLGGSAPGHSSLGAVVALPVGVVLDLALIPRFNASGASVASSVALLAGGAVALGVYRRLHWFGARELIPGSGDIRLLRSVAHRLLRGAAQRVLPQGG